MDDSDLRSHLSLLEEVKDVNGKINVKRTSIRMPQERKRALGGYANEYLPELENKWAQIITDDSHNKQSYQNLYRKRINKGLTKYLQLI